MKTNRFLRNYWRALPAIPYIIVFPLSVVGVTRFTAEAAVPRRVAGAPDYRDDYAYVIILISKHHAPNNLATTRPSNHLPQSNANRNHEVENIRPLHQRGLYA